MKATKFVIPTHWQSIKCVTFKAHNTQSNVFGSYKTKTTHTHYSWNNQKLLSTTAAVLNVKETGLMKKINILVGKN